MAQNLIQKCVLRTFSRALREVKKVRGDQGLRTRYICAVVGARYGDERCRQLLVAVASLWDETLECLQCEDVCLL